VPNFVDLELFHPRPEMRAAKRRELGLEAREVLVFSGTLGGRYPAGRIAEAVKAFFRLFGEESFFLLVTSSDKKRLAPLEDALHALGLKAGSHWRTLSAGPNEVPAWLNAADWGLLVLADFLTSETFLPLKFGEYLALGLPILTHPANREIVRLLESYGVGAALEGQEERGEPAVRLKREKDRMRERCLDTAREEFDLGRFAARYAELYRELDGG
jgi:glycosyltransferase involved in cell wall biosynthesis